MRHIQVGFQGHSRDMVQKTPEPRQWCVRDVVKSKVEADIQDCGWHICGKMETEEAWNNDRKV